MLKKLGLALVAGIAAVAGIGTGGACADLLGNTLVRPFAAYDSTGTLNYDYETRRLDAVAALLAVRFNGVDIQTPLNAGSFLLSVEMRSDGRFRRGVSGPDFIMTGSVDIDDDGHPEYTGVLLTGEVRAMGSQNSPTGTTDLFDFELDLTGGSMAGVYGKKLIIELTSEHSNFSGSFCADFNGGAKGTVGTKDGDECPKTADWWKCNRCDWTTEELVLGGVEYNDDQVYNLLRGRLPNGQNTSSTTARLAKYLAATKLNMLNGVDIPEGLVETIVLADAFLAAHPPGATVTSEQAAIANGLKDDLMEFVNSRPHGCGNCGDRDHDDYDDRCQPRRRGCWGWWRW